ncbi:hypothetical protein RCCS2_16436 [Roseobacter sp. CCS2]|nr:hypothetical protein RCCS2_16436 [Roseobacter sp. CCS2]
MGCRGRRQKPALPDNALCRAIGAGHAQYDLDRCIVEETSVTADD